MLGTSVFNILKDENIDGIAIAGIFLIERCHPLKHGIVGLHNHCLAMDYKVPLR